MIEPAELGKEGPMVFILSKELNAQLNNVVIDLFDGKDPLGLQLSPFLPHLQQELSGII